MSTIPIAVEGVTAEVTERRRYGTQTFTWVEFTTPDKVRHGCSDPWPCVTPKRSEVEDHARRLAEGVATGTWACRCNEAASSY